jgi:hypothetical protein
MKQHPFGYTIAMLVAVAIFIFTACEKDLEGPSFGDMDDLPRVGTLVEWPLIMYTVLADSLRTNALDDQFVGRIQDPILGTTEALFYVQFDLSQTSLDFGLNPQVDSVYWEVPFVNVSGNDKVPFKINIHESDEAISRVVGSTDSIVYSNGDIDKGALLSDHAFVPKPITLDAIGNTPAQPGFRIPLDKQFFQSRIIEAAADPAFSNVFNDNNAFVKHFKGLVVSADPLTQAMLSLRVFGVNNASISRIMIFYTAQNANGDTVKNNFALIHNNQNAVFNFYRHDRTNAQIDFAGQDTINGERETFIQSMAGCHTIVKIPNVHHLTDSGFVINYAELVVPMRQGNFLDGYNPFLDLSVAYRPAPDQLPTPIADVRETGQFALDGALRRDDPRRFTYRFRITRQLNRMMLNPELTDKLILIGSAHTGYRRVTINGNLFGDDSPVLKIYYTKPNR